MSHGKRARRAQAAEVHRMLVDVIRRLRRLLAREGPKARRLNPEGRAPCHTCAFNPATDGDRGFDTTVMGLAAALTRDDSFFCHEGLPRDEHGEWHFDPRVAVPCAGWLMLQDARQDAKRAIMCATAGRDLDDARADALLALVPPWPEPEASRSRAVPDIPPEDIRAFNLREALAKEQRQAEDRRRRDIEVAP